MYAILVNSVENGNRSRNQAGVWITTSFTSTWFFLQLSYNCTYGGISDVITCYATCHTYIGHSKLKGLQLYVGAQQAFVHGFLNDSNEWVAWQGHSYKCVVFMWHFLHVFILEDASKLLIPHIEGQFVGFVIYHSSALRNSFIDLAACSARGLLLHVV